MSYSFVPMTLDYIKMIKTWKYNGMVKYIYTDPYFESHSEGKNKLRGPGGCYGYAVLDSNNLIGLFEYYLDDDAMEIGLALKPSMTGKGYGKDFVIEGINFGIKEFKYNKKYIKLSVDKRNYPAIRIYNKIGFKKISEDYKEIIMHLYL